MDEDRPFSLEPHQVPAVPASNNWADHLRWCLAVMDNDDPDLVFIATLLPHALRHGRISVKHLDRAAPVVRRLYAEHASRSLDCQRVPVPCLALDPTSAVLGHA